MFDAATMSAALASLKAIMELARNAKDAQLAMKISSEVAEIQGKLLDVQQQALTLQDENQRLNELIQGLKDNSSLRERVSFHDGAYWEKQDDGSEAGPFCPSCWTDLKLRRGQVNDADGGIVQFACTEHKQPYVFDVPERLVKSVDLTRHQQHELHDSPDHGSGPDSWMR